MFGNSSSNTQGFTLIELLIGIALSALVASSLMGMLRGGVRMWRRMDQESMLRQEARGALEQIARDVRSSIDVPGIAWLAGDGKAEFARVQEDKIIRVRYQVADLGGLHRSRQELSPSIPGETIDMELTHHRTVVAWEYAYAAPRGAVEWSGVWNPPGARSLPAGVRARLTIYDDRGVPDQYTRTVFVPGRTLITWKS
jgi:prepilin-type N-terminal cleavage/methylation domain-containing protein